VILFRDLDDLPDEFRRSAITIGNFDGVHLGHARIVDRLVAASRKLGGAAVVFTFDPHPARVLRGEQVPPLCSTDRKAQLLAELGADALIAYPTSEAFLKLDPRQFFDQIVRRRFDARAVVEGPDFFFGRDRLGDIGVLRELCRDAGVALDVVEPVRLDGRIVSSSRIRTLLGRGQIDQARRMLTRPYRIRGTVIRGAARGANLGYPTANLANVETLLPGEGIYAGRAAVDGRLWPAAISLGPNPTFDEGVAKVEVHLVDYAGLLYDRDIEVDFLTRLRDIVRFDSVGQLVAQMDRDVATARQIASTPSWNTQTARNRHVSSSSQSSAVDRRASSVNWPRFVEIVHGNRRFLLTSHIRPDCDAVGSELGMAAILERLGKDVKIINPFEVPPNLRFIDPQRKLKTLGPDVPPEWIESIDVLMVLDTTAWAQLGDMGEVIRSTKAKKIVLDHHLSGDDLGAELFKDTGAEATGRLVLEAAEQLGVEVTPDVARALFAAVATDTGWFRFASTSARTYQLAAQLASAGAEPDQIYKDLYENDTLARLRLIGRAMARAQTELDGRLIHTWLERDDFDSTGAIPQDSEDVINMTLSVGGTQVAVILVEQPAGGFKVSFRSRCELDCSLVAEQFGGGGHKNAAGAFLREAISVAQSRVLDVVRAAMR